MKVFISALLRTQLFNLYCAWRTMLSLNSENMWLALNPVLITLNTSFFHVNLWSL